MSASIDVLPKEILHHVFSYLSMPDRLRVSLVCKKWLSVLNCKAFLRSIVILVNDNNKVPVLLQMSRNFLNFSFRFIIVDQKYYELFKCFSPVVESISFEKCEIWKRDPVIFDGLTYENLKVLKIIDCDLWTLFPSLPNLTELYLKGNSTITDDGLAILQKSMKRLKIFTIYCNITFEPKSFGRFYVEGSSYEKTPSPYILSLPALKSFIAERVSTLKEVNFNFNLTTYGLKELSSIENLHLNKICLRNCHDCVKGLIDLFKNQPNLKVINLNGMGLTSDIIEALCTLLPDLEEVHLNDCSLSNKSFGKVFRLKKLKILDISGNHPSDCGFSQAVSNFAPVYLQHLNLSGALLVESMELLIKKCKYLVYLNLSRCEVSDELLHFISENLVHLEDLSLKRNDITDYGLTGIDEKKEDQNKTESVDKDNHKAISNLKYLKKLKLNDCCKITELGIIKAIRFRYLEYLNLKGCNIGTNTVQTLLLSNPSINKLYCDCPIESEKGMLPAWLDAAT